MPQGKVKKGGARRIDRPSDVQGTGHTQRRDTSRFGVACEQSDGLMTHRSDRHQQ
jgi:hypothetical protein